MNMFGKLPARVVLLCALVLGALACGEVPKEIGDPVEARPLPPAEFVQHPYLAPAERSGMHAGSYNLDVGNNPGPLGRNSESVVRKFSRLVGVAPNISFDGKGRLITVSIQLTGIEFQIPGRRGPLGRQRREDLGSDHRHVPYQGDSESPPPKR